MRLLFVQFGLGVNDFISGDKVRISVTEPQPLADYEGVRSPAEYDALILASGRNSTLHTVGAPSGPPSSYLTT